MVKEAYYTPDTLRRRAVRFLDGLKGFRRRHSPLAFSPDQSALLVLDMQAYFLRPDSHAFVPAAPAILPGIGALIAAFAARRRPIVFTRHTNTSANAASMARWWRDLIAPDSPDSAIAPGLDVAPGRVIEKHQYDAFYQTGLEHLLRQDGVCQVVVTGVMTHLCCETTARSAFMRGFDVFFAVDGTAAYTAAFHQAALLNLAQGFAVPVLTEEILTVLENGRS